MRKIAYIEDFPTWKEEFTFSIEVKIRFSETDMFGHMNNVSPFIYFEEARIEFFKSVGLFNELTNQQSVPIVADIQCDYHEQVFFGEIIRLYVKVNSIGNSSMDVHYMATKNADGKVCLTGRGNMVNMNKNTGKAQPLTDEEKAKLLPKNK
ncbi:acyl-CoA thioesterase [Pseudogracilibacillus auburnensis]|uniref:acyl-CoA thioesterase n=1 Tax=Pseudogracilibacillus auburnensis TaxID=1494959 RepID=UPI000D75A49F|nr:thioesterase family protein [Pseudogracilibacillus auburnensis]MBO1002691.1 acyl-CoA thioesterase [Pseudogracilibacillus auburnensis]